MPDERRNMTIDECTTSGDKDNNQSHKKFTFETQFDFEHLYFQKIMNALVLIQILFRSFAGHRKFVKKGAMTLLELQKRMFAKNTQLLE